VSGKNCRIFERGFLYPQNVSLNYISIVKCSFDRSVLLKGERKCPILCATHNIACNWCVSMV